MHNGRAKPMSAGQCAICLEREAKVIAPACGHLVCCAACRRRLVHQARTEAGASDNTAHARRNLSTKQLERTKVPCPICRAESILVQQDRFDGQVYVTAQVEAVSDDEGKGEQRHRTNDRGGKLEVRNSIGTSFASSGPLAHEASLASSDHSGSRTALLDDAGAVVLDALAEAAAHQTALERQEAKQLQDGNKLHSRVSKLYRYATSSLMNDRDMDAFLGGLVYRVMQTSSFREGLYCGGKTANKFVEKRRKLKLRLSPGNRLDGKPSDGGDVAIEVGKLEEKEAAFGELVQGMLAEVNSLLVSATEHRDRCKAGSDVYTTACETLSIAEHLLALLKKYELRHNQRQVDLVHMIKHGVPFHRDDALYGDRLNIAMPQVSGMTTFMIDGAQISRGFVPGLHNRPSSSMRTAFMIEGSQSMIGGTNSLQGLVPSVFAGSCR